MARILFEIKVLPETKARLYKIRSFKKNKSWDNVFEPLLGTHKRLHDKDTHKRLHNNNTLMIDNIDILDINTVYVLRYSDTWHCQPSSNI